MPGSWVRPGAIFVLLAGLARSRDRVEVPRGRGIALDRPALPPLDGSNEFRHLGRLRRPFLGTRYLTDSCLGSLISFNALDIHLLHSRLPPRSGRRLPRTGRTPRRQHCFTRANAHREDCVPRQQAVMVLAGRFKGLQICGAFRSASLVDLAGLLLAQCLRVIDIEAYDNRFHDRHHQRSSFAGRWRLGIGREARLAGFTY